MSRSKINLLQKLLARHTDRQTHILVCHIRGHQAYKINANLNPNSNPNPINPKHNLK